MTGVAPSKDAVSVLRAIARDGFHYQRTKEICQSCGWELVDDELDLGYVAFDMGTAAGQGFPCRLAVEVSESGRSPRAFVPLFYFEDYDVGREPFDEAYWSLKDQLSQVLGPPSPCGDYTYPHRDRWRYFFSWWSLADATFVLVQDEFDIQFGMDVTLWVLPSDSAVAVPVNQE